MNPFAPSATWGKDWCGPLEGVFTLAQKYSWANAASVRDMRCLFGMPLSTFDKLTGSNTLLVNMTGKQGPRLQSSFLSYWAGDWTRLLASDTHFRYCPACIEYGYQSWIYQIAALARCPIHRCELLSACRTCGAPTCAYGVTSCAFDKPMRCHRCGSPWSSTSQIGRWSDSRDLWTRCQELLIWLDWVTRLRGRPVVPRTSLADLWDRAPELGPGAFADNRKTKAISAAYRAMAFEAAQAVAPCLARPDSLYPPSNEWRFMRVDMTSGSPNEDVAPIHGRDIKQIYKSFRRQFERRYLHGRRRVQRHLRELHKEYMSQPMSKEDPLVCAFMRWRQHFELHPRKPSPDDLDTIRYFASNPHLQIESFFREGVLQHLDLPENAAGLRLNALLFAASFYRACGETLAWCRKIQGAPNSSPTLPFGSSDRSSTLDDSFHRQALSPCWTRNHLRDANADARMVRQIGTLTATAKVVHALRDWHWDASPRAGDDPAH